MKKIALGIGALVVIIMLVVVAFTSMGGSDKWIDEFDDEDDLPDPLNVGNWGQEIIIEYEDGTIQSLKSILENQMLSIWVGGKIVVGMTYKLSAKASGGTKSNVKIDIGDYIYYHKLYQLGSNVWERKVVVSNIVSDAVVKIQVDDEWHEVFSVFAPAEDLYDSSLSGQFNYVFEPSGNLRYQVDDGSWKEADLPDNVGFIAEIKKDGNGIKVTFRQGHYP